MCPVAGGSGSPTIFSRITERPPSAATSAVPSMLPFSVFTRTDEPSCSNPVTRVLVRSSISSGSALQPSSSEPWISARCVTAYGLPKRRAKRLSSGMSMIFSPLTPSIISRLSMNTASFFTSFPTPSASSACQALGAIWMPAPISPNWGACSSTTLLNPLRASASAAARPPMPPPAMTTGLLFLEEDGDAIELTFGVHQVHALVRDLECIACLFIPIGPQPVLDQRAVEPLFLVAELHYRERRRHAQLGRGFAQDGNIAHLMHGARQRLTRVRARMPDLLHAQLEERAVVVDDRRGLVRILLAVLERHPVGRVLREELEPLLVALRVQQPCLVIQELLRRHESYSRATRASARG